MSTSQDPVSFQNLKGKRISLDNNSYYNLQTNRKNKNPRDDLITGLGNCRIIGSIDDLREFCRINRLQERDVIPSEFIILQKKLPWYQRIFSLGSKPKKSKTKDVEKLSDEQISSMREFNLQGLITKCKVISVTDGDTLDIIIFISGDFLLNQTVLGYKQNDGFFAKFRCRLSDIDAAEKNTFVGQEAKSILEDIINRKNGIFSCGVRGWDLYGRMLIELFDENQPKSINHFLIDAHPQCFHPYDGGTKIPFI